MDTSLIEAKFEKMGARVKVSAGRSPSLSGRAKTTLRRFNDPQPVRIDVRHDDRGEYFDVRHREDVRIDVLDVRPADRHMLVQAVSQERDWSAQPHGKFLCGHDERSWFVAAIPESSRAADVQGAKDALKPEEVWQAMREHNVHPKDRDKRRTKAFVRQGEWFFIPRPELRVAEHRVLRNEPIRRGRGKPHVCQFLHRIGGQVVYVNGQNPNGLTIREYMALSKEERQRGNFRTMQRDATVFVRGAVRHPDHATIWLTVWHQVVMNTETRAAAMAHVAFLD